MSGRSSAQAQGLPSAATAIFGRRCQSEPQTTRRFSSLPYWKMRLLKARLRAPNYKGSSNPCCTLASEIGADHGYHGARRLVTRSGDLIRTPALCSAQKEPALLAPYIADHHGEVRLTGNAWRNATPAMPEGARTRYALPQQGMLSRCNRNQWSSSTDDPVGEKGVG